MRTLVSLFLLLAIAAPAAGQSSATPPLTGFDLQPEPTATPTRNVPGPVDLERPSPTRTPAPQASATPATPRPAPGPNTAPPARQTSASRAPVPTPRPTIVATPVPTAARTVAQRRVATPLPTPAPAIVPNETPGAALDETDAASVPVPSPPGGDTVSEAVLEAQGSPVEKNNAPAAWPLWIVGGLALLGLAVVALLLLRRRKNVSLPVSTAAPGAAPSPMAVPVIPPVAESTAPPPEPQPVRIDAEVISLSRSFANATLSYAVTVSNLGTRALDDVRISADMTTAHSGAALDDQLATVRTALSELSITPSLSVGAATHADGVSRLPLNEVRLIRQGKAPLFVPLLRVRVEASGLAPVVRTFVVGRKPALGVTSSLSTATGRLEPFRLDETAQTYRDIAVRALD